MNRISKIAAVVTTAGLGLSAATGVASAASTTHGGANKTDVAFLKSNEQVNLTEITLAKIVLKRSEGYHAKMLARKTMADHQKAMASDKKIAQQDNITLPTKPNATQAAGAKELSTASRVALTYFKLQIAGHKTSIDQTKNEVANGHRYNIQAYAHYTYLPVAKHHLMMTRKDLTNFYANH